MLLASEFLGLGDEPYKGFPSTTMNNQIFITAFDMLYIYEFFKMFVFKKRERIWKILGRK